MDVMPPPAPRTTLAETETHLAAYEADDDFAANELFQRNGWTDGLPIVAPTPDRVAPFLDAAGLAMDDIVDTEPVRQRTITAGKIAINGVMAGCLPSCMPVLVAIVHALCAPEYSLHGASSSTGGSAPFIVVNGPIRAQLGMEARHSVFASANRANASIGRAIHLILMNVLGTVPGQLAFCIAEDEEDSPWVPLGQERRVAAGVSAETVMPSESPHQILNECTQ